MSAPAEPTPVPGSPVPGTTVPSSAMSSASASATAGARAIPEPAALPLRPPPQTVPIGYRQGIITAISVVLGFSLQFWRYYGLEAPGAWTWWSVLVAGPLVAAVAMQIMALFRSLRVEDDIVAEYRKTVRWLVASAMLMLCALVGSIAEDAFR